MIKFKLEDAVIELLKTNPFYGYMIQDCNIIYNDKHNARAGVFIKNFKVNLLLNTIKLSELTLKQQAGILQHEMDHILNKHIYRERKHLPKNSFESDGNNIAMDVAINEFNEAAQEIGVIVKHLREMFPDEEILNKQHYEYYKQFTDEMSKKQKEEFLAKLKGGNIKWDPNGHDIWFESDNLSEEELNELTKEMVKKAKDKSRGTIPSHLEELINDLLKSKINWKKELRYLIGKATTTVKEQSRMKRHRRYGLIFPGWKIKNKMKLVTCFDTSGSVSNEELSQYYTELSKIIEDNNIEATVIECDAKVHAIYEFTKNMKIKVKGRKGTLYQPAIDAAKKLNPDLIVYFGDGMCESNLTNPNIPFLWALSGSFDDFPVSWGKKLRIVCESS